MRKAICHYSFHRRYAEEKWDPKRLVREVRALGVEGIDFHARLLGIPPPQAAAVIRDALAGSGLTLSGFSLGNDFNQEDPAAFRAQVDAVKGWLPVAAEIGAPVSRIFGGHLPYDKRQDPAAKAKGRQRILDGLAEVVRVAEKLGVVLALENHGGLPCTGEEQVEVLRVINSRCLKATIDVGNYLSGGQEGHVGTAIAAADAAYVHFKDYKKVADPTAPYGRKLVSCVVGQGDVDHRACLRALMKSGYTGFIALEYEGIESEVTGVPQSVAFMNEVMSEPTP